MSQGLNLHTLRCFLANQYLTTKFTNFGTGGNLCWPASKPLSMHPKASGNISSMLPTSLMWFSAFAQSAFSVSLGISASVRMVGISSLRCWNNGSANDSMMDRKLWCEYSAGGVEIQYWLSCSIPCWKVACWRWLTAIMSGLPV